MDEINLTEFNDNWITPLDQGKQQYIGWVLKYFSSSTDKQEAEILIGLIDGYLANKQSK